MSVRVSRCHIGFVDDYILPVERGLHWIKESWLASGLPSNKSKEKCKESLEACIIDICKWMRTNKLNLNDDKTEVLFRTRQQMEKLKKNDKF